MEFKAKGQDSPDFPLTQQGSSTAVSATTHCPLPFPPLTALLLGQGSEGQLIRRREPVEIQTAEQSVWLSPGARPASKDQRTKGSADIGRKQCGTLVVYFKAGGMDQCQALSHSLFLSLCLSSWQFPYKAPYCWFTLGCLPSCSCYADAPEWLNTAKGAYAQQCNFSSQIQGVV